MRLIDADAAKKALTGWDTDPTDEEIEYTIDHIPTIDAVPVVRCKDCKIWYNGWCRLNVTVVEENEFCRYVKRKTNE